jgi:hypothetical protein
LPGLVSRLGAAGARSISQQAQSFLPAFAQANRIQWSTDR